MELKKRRILFSVLKATGIGIGFVIIVLLSAFCTVLGFENSDCDNLDGIEKREFSCYRGELEIRGTVFLPKEKSDLPIAIVSHEFMTNRLFAYPYALELARCGYAAFCFDFCGGGILCGSQGDSRDMSVMTEKEDLKAVITFAKEQTYTNDAPILLMGCSQGGLVSALTAAEMGNEVGGLILQYPALQIPDAARKGEMLWMKFDPDNIPEQMWSGPMRIGNRYVTDVIDVDILPTITQYTGNVLIIHGDKDTLVNIAGSEKAKEAYLAAGADVRMEIIEGGNHIFLKPKHINTAKSFVAEFAKECIFVGSLYVQKSAETMLEKNPRTHLSQIKSAYAYCHFMCQHYGNAAVIHGCDLFLVQVECNH